MKETVDVRPDAFFEGDGRLVNLSLGLGSSEMPLKTRAVLPEERENAVEDLYILLFKLASDDDTNPVAVNTKRYFTKNEIIDARAETGHVSAGSVEIHGVPTGTYIIAAVANVKGSIDGIKLRDDLDAVTDYSGFKNVKADLLSDGDLTRSIMTMSGFYRPAGATSHADAQPVTISTSGQLGGYIHLRRLDAQVHFNITQEIPGVKSFHLKSWKVVNIPKSSRIVETSDPDLCAQYNSTIANTGGWTSTTGVGDVMTKYELDFYMLENHGKKNGSGQLVNDLDNTLDGITDYKLRELEQKESDGTNPASPKFINAPANSAYLVLEADFQQTLTEGGQTFDRFAQAQYIIHLGYCDEKTINGKTSKANDFNNDRNIRYTYNVKIVGANEIVIEADKTDPDDWNHGAEGTVIDLKGGEMIDLDAHYAVFNIVLTPRELAESEFIMNTPNAPNGSWSTVGRSFGDPGYPDPYTEDYQHIRVSFNLEGTKQLKAGKNITRLVSYTNTYDFDCPAGTSISSITPGSHQMIPVHHEIKQIQNAQHPVAVYSMHPLKKDYGFDVVSSGKVAGTVYGRDYINSLQAGSVADEPLVFTVFLNEFYYYYTDGVIAHTEHYGDDGRIASGETPRDYTMWKKFVNIPEGRSFIVLANINTSDDSDSKHLTAKYHIRQRSIETFYGDHILDGYSSTSPDLPAAMGLEQINEHHYKHLSATTNYSYGNNSERGWDITRRNLMASGKATWAYHVDQTVVLGTPGGSSAADLDRGDNDNGANIYGVFRSKTAQELGYVSGTSWDYKTIANDRNNHEVIDVAATRNRDLNRDGNVSQDEVRWFAPTSREYVTFAVGAGALPTPLFDKTRFDPAVKYWQAWPINFNFRQVYYNGIFHFLGSDWWYVVSEEGTSTGKSNTMGDDKNHDCLNTQLSGGVRCARYLGVTTGDNGYDGINLPDPASFDESTYVVNTVNYSKQMHRSASSGSLPAHNNLNLGNNGYNSVADYFQVARANSAPGALNIGGVDKNGNNLNAEDYLLYKMNNNLFCNEYSEAPDGSDIHTWRVPNQVELSLMFNYMPAALLSFGNDATSPANPNLLSCTFWYRNDEITSNYEGELNGSFKRHFMGGRADGEGRKLAMIHAKNLYNNKHYAVRCVRDTDKEGNFVGSPYYGKFLDFEFGEIAVSGGDYTAKATMNSAAVVNSVVIGDVTTSATNSGTSFSATANVLGACDFVRVTWNITFNGKQYSKSKIYGCASSYNFLALSNNQYGANKLFYAASGQTAADTANNPNVSNLQNLGPEYRWIVSASMDRIVNVASLQDETPYYLFNAGTMTFLSAPISWTTNYPSVPMGDTPVRVKIKTSNSYKVMYVIDDAGNRKGWINNISSKGFGYWATPDDKSTGVGNMLVFRPGTAH